MMSAAAVEAQSSSWVGGAMGGMMGGTMGGAYCGVNVPAPVLAYQGCGDGFGNGSAVDGPTFGNGSAAHLVNPGPVSPQGMAIGGHPQLGGHSPHERGSPGGGGEGGMQ